jgi:hypothetical protein
MNKEIDHKIVDAIKETRFGSIFNILSFDAFDNMHKDIDFSHIRNEFWTKSNVSNNYRRMHGLPLMRKQTFKIKYRKYLGEIMEIYDCSLDKAKMLDRLGPIRDNFFVF